MTGDSVGWLCEVTVCGHAGEMAQKKGYLLCNHGDPNLDLQLPCKKPNIVLDLCPRAGEWRKEDLQSSLVS